MREYAADNARCPYYGYEKPTLIHCEGVEEGTAINLTFANTKRNNEYRHQHCYSIKGYKECRIARMLDQKWEEF